MRGIMLVALFMLVGLLSAPAQAGVNLACCSAQKHQCDAFCRTPQGIAQGQKCPTACASFVSRCRQTGLFVWRGGRTVSCQG